MKVLGIESSCDECAAAVVEDGVRILSNVVATQIPYHAAYRGVVPEIASRKHTEWIYDVCAAALRDAGLESARIDGVAATGRPGLTGSLLVGLGFAKAFAYARGLPFVSCDHILSHLYAAQFVQPPPAYPFLGLLVSGGHTLICRVDSFDAIDVLGGTVDDAAGEAFDKVARHFGWGYPGGKFVDALAAGGDAEAFDFPVARLARKGRRCDVSYSGLKTAVVNQLEQFRRRGAPGHIHPPDIAASFQKAAVETLLGALSNAVEDTGIATVVSGGGVAANSYLRERLFRLAGVRCIFPPPELCGDNAAMVAGIGYQYLSRGMTSPLTVAPAARVKAFQRR
ncbi:MAG: tRNA (adenosine(37)-N6)-threonylcarbamoyltransferase complex transferase subunit TsaD [Spirochaetaceae bacterium]|jgi:N6-L-threonylcarbamoyladenine synthase|nr:tRNA (adenosine(37)-N6)-threonylcarbamoyltransferase complex transferase subunit TsaD [Spirochaetaceae bacterium]